MNEEVSYHYYGDSVRLLFFFGGLIMIISYPFFASFIKAPIAFSVIGCISLAVFAGLMNPKQKWIIVLNTIISIAAFIVFEYSAVYAYLYLSPAESIHLAFFWVNQLLSLLFFFSAYLSTKTLRGHFLNK